MGLCGSNCWMRRAHDKFVMFEMRGIKVFVEISRTLGGRIKQAN